MLSNKHQSFKLISPTLAHGHVSILDRSDIWKQTVEIGITLVSLLSGFCRSFFNLYQVKKLFGVF